MATVGRLYSYDIQDDDADGEPLAYELLAGPIGMSIDGARGTVRWLPQHDQLESTEAVAGQTYLYAVDAVDPEHDPLTYGLLMGPVGLASKGFTSDEALKNADNYRCYARAVTLAFERLAAEILWDRDGRRGEPRGQVLTSHTVNHCALSNWLGRMPSGTTRQFG